MNIFLPYDNSATLSARALDDKRLLKQILETRQILQVAKGESKSFKNHPITKHYIEYPEFLYHYGYCFCVEYKDRFNKEHAYYNYFEEEYFNINKERLFWIPFYAAGAKKSPDCVRTIENVSELYQNKLCEKWQEDIAKGRPPKWTNRLPPEFYYKKMNKKEE